MSQLNIVIVGASCAGMAAFHTSLKHILPALPKEDKTSYHVYLVNPEDHFLFRIAGPRAVVSEELMPQAKYWYPLAEAFKQYPEEQFTFIQGHATSLDPEARTITIQTKADDETPQTISYHALVIASGARTPSAAFSVLPTGQTTPSAIKDLHTRLPKAKTILIGGGGPVAVETAGEIGEFLNGKPGWFATKPANPKAEITVATAGEKLLPFLPVKVAKKAETLLARLGVEVQYKTAVKSVTTNEDGTSTVTFTNDTSRTVDVYIPAIGRTPNTEFLPSSWLNDKGYVLSDPKTLRVEVGGPRVFAFGDVGAHSRGDMFNFYNSVPIFSANFKRDMLLHAGISTPGVDKEFTDNRSETQVVPIGPSTGVGAVFGWSVPGFFVRLIKGKDYFTGSAHGDFILGNKFSKAP